MVGQSFTGAVDSYMNFATASSQHSRINWPHFFDDPLGDVDSRT